MEILGTSETLQIHLKRMLARKQPEDRAAVEA
jgi:hypothetical protein